MGWKMFAVFATEERDAYFGSSPSHDPALADSIRARLGLYAYEPAGPQSFDQAMYPQGGELCIGAYPHGIALCHTDLPSYFFDEHPRRRISGAKIEFNAFKSRLLRLYPEGQVMAIVLHGVVNLWGYTVYSQGQLVRSAAGAADDGLIVSVGAPLLEEAKVLQQCPIEKVDEEGYGEELVFDVSSRLFGKRVDQFDTINLQMTAYKRKSSGPVSLLKKLFGHT